MNELKVDNLCVLNGNGLESLGPTEDLVCLAGNILTLDEWFALLSKSDFFVAAPGTVMPFSHNIVEAMSVGCIPITEYGDFFTPPLVDQAAHLAYRGKADAVRVIREAIDLDQARISAMRETVLAYYDAHLDPESVIQSLYSARERLSKVYLIAGHNSVAHLRDNSNRTARLEENRESL
ncbi:MAG: glycosyltransferase [Pyrinomonadaceae bacterium]